MSTPIEPQDEPKRNTLAITSLILGALSVAFAQFCTMPGNISVVGCLGGILAIAAAVTGVMGIRAAQQGQGKRPAIGGIFTAAIGLVVFLFVFIPAMVTPGGLWTYVQATPTPTITPTPTMTPTPTITPTVTPEPTSTPAPQTYYGETFAITYTDEWEIYQTHSEPGREYLIIDNPHGLSIHVYQYTLEEEPNLEREAAAFLSDFDSISMIAEGEIVIDGQGGLTKRFVFQGSGGQNHALMAIVANEYDLYAIFVIASSQEVFTRYQVETEAIVASIRFTTEGAPAPTAAPEVAPPTSVLPTDIPEEITYTGDGFTLTYPGDWVEVDSSDAPMCQQPGAACLFLVHTSEDGTEFLLIRLPLEEDVTVEEIDQSRWDQYADAGAELISQDTVEIDGRPGIERVFSFPVSSSPTGQIFARQILIVNENDLYQLGTNSTSAELLMKHQSAVDGIIDSLKFTE